MVKIAGWAADGRQCGYWRMQVPFAELRGQFGLDAPVELDIRELAPSPGDLVVGQRIADPAMSQVWGYLKSAGCKLVFELDDDLWNVPGTDPRVQAYWNSVRPWLGANIALADLVTVSTEHLAEKARRWNDNVVVLPNYADAALLEHDRPHGESGTVTIGWAGSSSHLIDFPPIAPVLALTLATHPSAQLHIVGQDYGSLVGRPYRYSGWFDDIPTYLRALDFDIGLAPLADVDFNHSKSHLKVLEYAMLGIPTVASDVGPYADFVEHGVTGFLVRTDADWADYLHALIENPELRAQMGEAARRRASEYTIQGNVHKWAIAYGELV